LERRFRHAEWTFPDTAVFDGGKIQLRVGGNLVSRFSWKTNVFSVVKDDKHKPKEILSYKNRQSVVSDGLKRILLSANAEAHRFALNSHRKRARKLKFPTL